MTIANNAVSNNCKKIVAWMLATGLAAGTTAGWAADTTKPAAKPAEKTYPRPEGLVQGGAFIDLIQPIPITGGLSTDCWGGDNVKPRVVSNGIEDPKWSYWCASRILGPDGKEHLFTVRWPQDKGHKYWVRSELVHAVADQPTGPFTVVQEIGPGHNADIYQTTDGTYVASVSGKDYRSQNIHGPWTLVKPRFDVLEPSMSNKTFARREDGSFLLVVRSGSVWISNDGLQPFRRIFPSSVYPFHLINGTAFEDPCVWRDEVQYHMIINCWPQRRAFYGRSKDGLHWIWEAGSAFDNNVVRHPDGKIEAWNKIERPKVRQDEFGRATHLYLAVIDAPKEECTGTSNHSSKAVVVPLIVGRRLAILNDRPITADTAEIKVEIKAEPGFDPQADVDVKSLTFGAAELVNFGKGCRAIKSEPSGKNLVVTFDGKDNGLKDSDFAAKLLGKTAKGGILFGHVRVPGQTDFTPMLVARMIQWTRNADGSLKITVPIENVGLIASQAAASVKLKLIQPKHERTPAKELFAATAAQPVPILKTYESTVIEFPVPAGVVAADKYCDVNVIFNPDTPAADTFVFKEYSFIFNARQKQITRPPAPGVRSAQ